MIEVLDRVGHFYVDFIVPLGAFLGIAATIRVAVLEKEIRELRERLK